MSEELVSKYDIRGTEETGLTLECAWNVGKALADWLPDGETVIAYLPTQKRMSGAIIEGLRLQGRTVIDGGNGDSEAVKTYIATNKFAGGVAVGFDELEKVITIELYNETARLIDGENGLQEIRELVKAGNFVPAATKGGLIQTA